uniref:Uncharacterized protein n=1 Tax=Ascaris lumbricoides TaxID=6252 RepID=A0A9J2Q065_ASCLU
MFSRGNGPAHTIANPELSQPAVSSSGQKNCLTLASEAGSRSLLAETEGLSEEELKILRARFRMRQNRFTAISGACTLRPEEEPTIFEKIKTKLQPVKAKIKTRAIVVTHSPGKSEKGYEGEERSTRSAYSTVSSQYSSVMSEMSERSVRSVRKLPDGASGKSSNSAYGKLPFSGSGKSRASTYGKLPSASTYGKLPSADSNSRSTYGELSSEVTKKTIRRRKEGTEQSERSVRRKFAGKDRMASFSVPENLL